jgi:hypothetical protein
MLIYWGKSHSQNPAAIFGITNNPFHLIPSYLSTRKRLRNKATLASGGEWRWTASSII